MNMTASHIPMHDIIVRQQGRIAATVTHQALLLASGGRYARLQSGS
jgi:ABC-type transport system involved in Fe-S cluster assembly fused permease/ATPase subunit